jgi:DNA-binding XRE family transcriptional regulator
MEEEVRRAIGRRLKEARESAKLTQAAVAPELGVNRQAISSWENGREMPRCDAWFKLGPLYGVSLDYLVYGIRTIPVSQYAVMAEVFGRRTEDRTLA